MSDFFHTNRCSARSLRITTEIDRYIYCRCSQQEMIANIIIFSWCVKTQWMTVYLQADVKEREKEEIHSRWKKKQMYQPKSYSRIKAKVMLLPLNVVAPVHQRWAQVSKNEEPTQWRNKRILQRALGLLILLLMCVNSYRDR